MFRTGLKSTTLPKNELLHTSASSTILTSEFETPIY